MDASGREKIRWWQWPNVLAIDAALVAVGWLSLVGVFYVGYAQMAVLGLSVWLVYTADRWLDARGLPEDQLVTARHRFAKQHAKPLLVIWFVVLVVDVTVALVWLKDVVLIAGAGLMLICYFYIVAVHRRWPVPKEILVAVIFTAGIVLFTDYARFTESGYRWLIASLSILFFANVILIASQERQLDEKMGRQSLVKYFPAIMPLVLAMLVSNFVLLFREGSGIWVVYLPQLGLIVLYVIRNKLSAELFRVLADGVLLLPWVMVIRLWLQ